MFTIAAHQRLFSGGHELAQKVGNGCDSAATGRKGIAGWVPDGERENRTPRVGQGRCFLAVLGCEFSLRIRHPVNNRLGKEHGAEYLLPIDLNGRDVPRVKVEGKFVLETTVWIA